MFQLFLDDGLASKTLDELINKLHKITEALETKKTEYITGQNVDLDDEYLVGWTLVQYDGDKPMDFDEDEDIYDGFEDDDDFDDFDVDEDIYEAFDDDDDDEEEDYR